VGPPLRLTAAAMVARCHNSCARSLIWTGYRAPQCAQAAALRLLRGTMRRRRPLQLTASLLSGSCFRYERRAPRPFSLLAPPNTYQAPAAEVSAPLGISSKEDVGRAEFYHARYPDRGGAGCRFGDFASSRRDCFIGCVRVSPRGKASSPREERSTLRRELPGVPRYAKGEPSFISRHS
jgi:hypothetical protein